MKIKNFRDIFALVYIIVLLAWLAVAILLVAPMILDNPEGLDPFLALITGLGVGGVTQFFILIGTLIYQFYFRKTPESEK
jgi:hypothetical protein